MRFHSKNTAMIITLCTIVALVGLALTASSVSAQTPPQILLTVDVSDPSAIVFTTTGNAPLVDSSDYVGASGVTLFDLFAVDSNLNGIHLVTGDMAAPNVPAYTNVLSDSGLVGPRDLNLVVAGVFGSANAQQFSTGSAAFAGSSVVNLIGTTFRAIGSIGDIRGGDGFNGGFNPGFGPVLGQYQILIPEPASLALLGLGGLILLRRRLGRDDNQRRSNMPT